MSEQDQHGGGHRKKRDDQGHREEGRAREGSRHQQACSGQDGHHEGVGDEARGQVGRDEEERAHQDIAEEGRGHEGGREEAGGHEGRREEEHAHEGRDRHGTRRQDGHREAWVEQVGEQVGEQVVEQGVEQGRYAAGREDESPWTAEELREVRAELEAEVARLGSEISQAESGLQDLLRDSGDGAGDDQADAGAKTFEREQEISLANNSREMLLQSRAGARPDRRTAPTASASPAATRSARCGCRSSHVRPCAWHANSARNVAETDRRPPSPAPRRRGLVAGARSASPLAVYALDQLTKALAVARLRPGEPRRRSSATCCGCDLIRNAGRRVLDRRPGSPGC